MRRLLAVVLPLLVFLAAPAVSPAKGIMSGEVCGANGCRSIESTDDSLLQGGPPVAAPSAREPFVWLDFRVGEPGHVERARTLFLPRSGLVLPEGSSTWMRPVAPEALRALARQVTAFPARELPASAPLAPAPRESPPGAATTWWPVPLVAVIALAGAAAIVRRRRGDGAGRSAAGQAGLS